MKIILLIFSLTFTAFTTIAQPTDKAFKPGWKLVFYDEFDSNGLNLTKWKQAPGWTKWFGDNLAYAPENDNVAFRDGKLVITSKKETITGICDNWDSTGHYKPVSKQFDYSTGLIYSQKAFKYGYFECGFKVPEGKGFNSAFWLIGPKSELDIFEILGSRTKRTNMTLHWKGKEAVSGKRMAVSNYNLPKGSFSREYHHIASEWNPDQIRFYVDGRPVSIKNKTNRLMLRHLPQTGMNVIISLGVGIIDGKPDQKTPFPSEFLVDYFRVYSHDSTEIPLITGQKTIQLNSKDKSFNFKMNDLIVSDHYKMYPHGFAVKISDSATTVLNDKEKIISLSIRVSDGINESNLFHLKILQSDSNYQMEKFPAGYSIITNTDAQTLTMSSESGEFQFDNIFLADASMQLSAYSIERTENKYIIKPDKAVNGKFFLIILVYKQIFCYPVIF